ncbi:DNA metabolism protein [Lithospermum erythrorhizon]|uniref:DNA metabolism protein n=1 Tax=Lithospermum erythrorhizon TaxID=34254 RepID=A0AAV3P623_LITER
MLNNRSLKLIEIDLKLKYYNITIHDQPNTDKVINLSVSSKTQKTISMALEQTLSLISPNNLIFPKPNTTTLTSSLSLSKPNFNTKPTRFLKCSYDYNNNNGISTNTKNGVFDNRYGVVQYPRPTEVKWNKEVSNLVHLMGSVGVPVQIKHLSSGKVLAWSRLAVKRSQNETLWINLTFWDDLAHIASQHVEKGQQIYVTGRLVSDTTENEEGKQQTFYKVVVQQLNFVERSFPSGGMYNGDSNPMSPGKRQGVNHTGSIEELWQAFFANPTEWWDNRKNKRSPNYPDFKHKDTGEALWVEGRTNPTWVKSQLAVLDSKMDSLHDQNASSPVNFMSTDNFSLY